MDLLNNSSRMRKYVYHRGSEKSEKKEKKLAMFICVCLLSSLMMPIVAVASDGEAELGYDPYSILVVIRQDLQGGSTPDDLNNAADYFNSFLSVPNAVTKTQELLFIEPDPDADVPTDEDSSVPKSIVKLLLSEEGSQKLDQLLGELLTNPFVALPESPDLFCGENYTLYGMNYLLFANTENMNIGMLKEAALHFDGQLVDANGEPFADDTLPISTGAQIIFPGSNPLMLPPQRVGVLGDGTGDGRVNTADARFALRMAVGLDELERDERYNLSVFVLDTDLSGTVTTSDARTLLRYTVGLEKNLMTDWNDAYGDMVRRMIFHDGVE